MERDIMKGKGRFILKDTHCLKINEKHIKVKTSDFNLSNGLLILGTTSGEFQLMRITGHTPEVIQEFEIGSFQIDQVTLNSTGNWIAMGVVENG